MAPIAKWLVPGVAAAAQRYRTPPAQPKRLAHRIENLEIALYANGAVVLYRDFRGRHLQNSIMCIQWQGAGTP
jgi:hypothetical protein